MNMKSCLALKNNIRKNTMLRGFKDDGSEDKWSIVETSSFYQIDPNQSTDTKTHILPGKKYLPKWQIHKAFDFLDAHGQKTKNKLNTCYVLAAKSRIKNPTIKDMVVMNVLDIRFLVPLSELNI